MDLLCRFGSHVAQSRTISNDGLSFSKCKRCGCALVRRASEAWQAVPKGYRIVWKKCSVDRRRLDPLREIPEQAYFNFN